MADFADRFRFLRWGQRYTLCSQPKQQRNSPAHAGQHHQPQHPQPMHVPLAWANDALPDGEGSRHDTSGADSPIIAPSLSRGLPAWRYTPKRCDRFFCAIGSQLAPRNRSIGTFFRFDDLFRELANIIHNVTPRNQTSTKIQP
jgi:hypothetical protein